MISLDQSIRIREDINFQESLSSEAVEAILGLSLRGISDDISVHIAFMIKYSDILERVTPRAMKLKANVSESNRFITTM